MFSVCFFFYFVCDARRQF